jgi:hypothetical protein
MAKPKQRRRDKYDVAGQFKNELHGLIDRHKLENDIRLMDVISMMEMAKFELLASAMAEVDEDLGMEDNKN